MEAWRAFDAWGEDLTRRVVEWTTPGLVLEERANHGWPLTRFSHMIAALVLYCAWLAYGLVKRAASRGGKSAEREGDAAPRTTVTWGTVLANPGKALAPLASDPVKALQTVYNVVQVSEGKSATRR